MEALRDEEVLFKWSLGGFRDFYHGFVVGVKDSHAIFDLLYLMPISGKLILFEARTGVSTVPKYPGFFKVLHHSRRVGPNKSSFLLSGIEILEVNR